MIDAFRRPLLAVLLGLALLPAVLHAEPLPARQLTEAEWRVWAEAYLAEVDPQSRVDGINPFGSVAGERTATAVAERLFRERLGRAAADAERPYRAFRRRNLWVVVGGAQPPGQGLLLVLSRDAGVVMRMQAAVSAAEGAGEQPVGR